MPTQPDIAAALDARLLALELDRDKPYGLASKIARVQLELEDVPRAGHAEVQTRSGGSYSYDYITEADLMKAVRPLLARYGVAVFYSDSIVKPQTADDAGAIVRVQLELVDGDSGESRTLTGEGYAVDAGDKAANKAKTNAVRYLLWKCFLQPSDEDPEQESQNARDAAQVRSGRAGGSRTGRQSRVEQQTPGRLRDRITQLAVELDEVQGRKPGETLGELLETFELGELEAPDLVKIGTALAQHVTAERELSEQQKVEYVPTPFTAPA